ncbi:MAG: tetratricopeptide repeat protein [Planctomycetales bacterium]|nr:tetratricopeptide repeat protein [Planctomycetales bacterium]
MFRSHWSVFRCVIFGLISVIPSWSVAQVDEPAESGKTPQISSVVAIPRSIHEAMQSRQYMDAVKEIETQLQNDDVRSADYLMYLKGVALSEADQRDEAVAAFLALEKQYPDSDWISRSRFGRASIAVANRQYNQAGQIYREEAERLLSRGRKDELSKIYLEFADRFFDGVPANDPSKVKQPDYNQALEYYREANKLGPTLAKQQQIEFRVARCLEELRQLDEAAKAYQAFLRQHGDDRKGTELAASTELLTDAQYRLGLCQLGNNQPSAARRTWQDFLSSHESTPGLSDTVSQRLADAKFHMAHTYGLPTPATIGDLELGVGLAEQFLKAYPQHKLAPKAELEIARGYEIHGRNVQAVDRLESLIANPNYKDSEELAVARRMLGQSYVAQNEFDKAIEAWKEFLEKHPTDPEWPVVQQNIIGAEYAAAQHALRQKKYADARAMWQTFLNKYPLDERAPNILFQFGEMNFQDAQERHQRRVDTAEKQGRPSNEITLNKVCRDLYQDAIADWQRLVQKYPDSDQASVAMLRIGITLEDMLQRRKEALESYRKVKGRSESAAKKRIERLTQPQLQVITKRKFRSDEDPSILLTTRNLENVSVAVYSIDMTDYFRKMHLATGVEQLDIALIDPDAQFDHAVAKYEPFKQIEQEVKIPVDGPGVTAVTVSSDKMEATTMVVVSDLDILVKSSRNELFLFAEEMRTGTPAPGTSVLISDGDTVFAELVTDQEGIARTDSATLRDVKDLRVFAVKEGNIASTVTNLNGLDFAVGLVPTGYLFTDRPAYRPGELVNIKGIVRWVDQDRFTFQEGEAFTLDIYDSRGRRIKTETVKLNAFGTVHTNLVLPESSVAGLCRVHLHRSSTPDKPELSFDTQFEVKQFDLEPVQLTIETDKSVYFRGDEITATASLGYYYGAPLAGQDVNYWIGDDGDVQTTKTNDDGKVELKFPTRRFSESSTLTINVDCPERNVRQSQVVYLATRGFSVNVTTVRSVFIAGETFDAKIKVADPAGKPVGTPLKLELFEVTKNLAEASDTTTTGERLIETFEIASDSETGEVTKTVEIKSGGLYLVRATGTDQFDNSVSGQTRVQISGDDDKTRLRLLADTHSYQVGDEAEVRLHWRESSALALITFDGASVLGHRLVNLKQGENRIRIPIDADLAPNFYLSACVMQRDKFHEAGSPFVVAKRLSVKLTPTETEVIPTGRVKVGIEVTDSSGRPVSAELSLAMIQSGLLERFPQRQESIVDAFTSDMRQRRIRQTSSCTFRYTPRTRSINEALLAETERLARRRAEADALADRFGDQDQDGVTEMLAGDPNDPFFGNQVIARGSSLQQQIQRGLQSLDQSLDQSAALGAQVSGQFDVDFEARNDSGVQYGFAGRAGLPSPYYLQDDVQYFPSTPGQRRQVLQSYTVQIPYTEQVIQNGRTVNVTRLRTEERVRTVLLGGVAGAPNQQLPQFGSNQSQQYAKAFAFFSATRPLDNQSLQRRDVTFNGLTADGRLLVVNGMPQNDFVTLTNVQGARILAGVMAGETGYWDPVITTDEQGKAEVEITMPTESTAWRLQANAISAETLAGSESAEIVTRKTLFGQLTLPMAFTVGDKANLKVEIHNSLEGARVIDVRLKATSDNQSLEQTQSISVDDAGIKSIEFPVQIVESDELQFELTVSTKGEPQDTSVATVDVLPYGIPIYQTASGTASQNTLALIKLDNQQKSKGQSLELIIGGNINDSLLDSMLGGDLLVPQRCIATSYLSRSVSDCMAGVALLETIRRSAQQDSPQATKITEIVAGAISNLIASQRDEGDWGLSGKSDASADAMISARIMWALSGARKAGFAVPSLQFELGVAALKKSFAAESDLNRQSVILSALAECGAGDFALANRLYRERNRLDDYGLVQLMLALTSLNHDEMAAELIQLIKLDAAETYFVVGRTSVEIAALQLIAMQRIDAKPELRAKLAERLLAARAGSRWPVETDNGPAIAALANHFGQNPPRSEKVALTIYVNGEELEKITIEPGAASRRIEVPGDMLVYDQQRVEFELDGRGEFSYSAVLTGFADADSVTNTTKDWSVSRRYEPDQLRVDGRLVPRGHGVINGSYSWTPNQLTELPVGIRGNVTLSPRIRYQNSRPLKSYLMLVEPIPAGCRILEETISGVFDRYDITPGAITFYIGDSRVPGDIHYTLAGYLSGQYRAAPAVLRSYFSPSEIAVSAPAKLQVLAAGKKSSDPYKLTPDELFSLGKTHFSKREFQKSYDHLSDLLSNWQLDPEPYKESVTLAFRSAMNLQNHADTVKFFEVIKERFPEVELSFEEILKVAAAYREISEYERSYLVYRATVQGSFEKESQVAGFLNARGEFLRSVQAMESLLRDYPAESYVATASYALAQEVYRRAETVNDDQKLVDAKITRVKLIDSSIGMLDDFVTNWPEDPSSDQASFAIATALIDLEQYQRAIERGQQYAQRYPDSRLLDSFWYMIGFCYFELQDHQKALEMCRKVAEASFQDPATGSTRQADNKWEAIYIMGQIHHSLGQAAKAIDEYAKVVERFKDAAEAIEFFSRKAVALPDVTTLLPEDKPEVLLQHRNVAEVFIKVYRIDLMKFGLTQRNLDRITAINLAGIKPYHQETIALGDGNDYRDRETKLTLPLKEEGAYLVVCRGENLYSSGLIVVSPLTLSVEEDAVSGRVRVSVKDKRKDAFVGDVDVKVIGSANDKFVSGQTDLRGLFVADAIKGTSTVIAVSQDNQYAFHRGKIPLLVQKGQVLEEREPAANASGSTNHPFGEDADEPFDGAPAGKAGKPLLNNLFNQNGVFQQEQKLNIDGLMNNRREGIQTKEAY